MDQTNQQPNPQHDDQLADFADQVMQGKRTQPASIVTDDLFGLEETILHLNGTFAQTPLDESRVKQMHVRLKSRIRREEQNVKPSFWKKWFGRESTPQLALAFAVLAVLVVVFVSAPFLTPVDSSATGTASGSVSLIVAASLIGAIFVIYFGARRK
jgi:hypothetical protein